MKKIIKKYKVKLLTWDGNLIEEYENIYIASEKLDIPLSTIQNSIYSNKVDIVQFNHSNNNWEYYTRFGLQFSCDKRKEMKEWLDDHNIKKVIKKRGASKFFANIFKYGIKK